MPGLASLVSIGRRLAASPALRQIGRTALQRYGGRAATLGRAGLRIGAAGAAFEGGSRLVRGAFNGEEEGERRPSRRINPMNARAAMRAIRRIGKVRKILRRIESKMPKRPCRCGAKRRRS